ncbi:restriction endonuclease, partial [Escherichia coli]|nr:restriction endonuclease [Escherichia coli]
DINNLRLERGIVHYNEPIAWAQEILRGMSPSALQGNTKAISLLFPMEAVVESFVSPTLPYELPSHLIV